MSLMNNFGVLILTHGRPDRVFTYKTLRDSGYTGRIYLLVDNEDSSVQQYRQKYGDEVVVFDKEAISKTFDSGDNFNDKRSPVYARNASFQVAKGLGLRYFLQLDDDYTRFSYKYDNMGEFGTWDIRNLDAVLSLLLEYFISTPSLSIAIAQGGDFMGGADNQFAKSRARRKVMNTFFCDTERPFKFVGTMNDDVNTYISIGFIGGLFLTIPELCVQQRATQSNPGGITELYLKFGTYVKSFYSVMYMPSSVKIIMMGTSHRRIHHSVSWLNTVPAIIREEHRKQPETSHATMATEIA